MARENAGGRARKIVVWYSSTSGGVWLISWREGAFRARRRPDNLAKSKRKALAPNKEICGRIYRGIAGEEGMADESEFVYEAKNARAAFCWLK